MPIQPLLKHHLKPIILGGLAMVVCYNLFYTSTVFCLSYGTSKLGITRVDFLKMLCIAVLIMIAATPFSARLSDRFGRRPVLLTGCALAVLTGFALAPMLASGDSIQVTLFLAVALGLMGVTFAPMGAFLPEQFPVAVRYTGAGLSYQLGGILGASFAPAASQILVNSGGLTWVGYYMSAMALVSFAAIWCAQETANA
jgi:MFS family permease